MQDEYDYENLQAAPVVQYPYDDNGLYSLVMSDQDNPYVHWGVNNIPGPYVDQGYPFLPFVPLPFFFPWYGGYGGYGGGGYGGRNYVVNTYRQPGRINNGGEYNRQGFNEGEYARNNGLQRNSSANFRASGVSRGGFGGHGGGGGHSGGG